MALIPLIQNLQKMAESHHKKIFSLKEISMLMGASLSASAMSLLRAEKKGLVERVENLWINQMNPPELLEVALAYPRASYLSFESALYQKGIISQLPRGGLTLATSGRPGLVYTHSGMIQFTHLKASLFFGFDEHRIAFPEKAYLDLIYIRGLKGRENIFHEEIDSEGFNKTRLKEFSKFYPSWVKEKIYR